MESQHPLRYWHCRDRYLPVHSRTLVMGILNVTPDSFSDGGQFVCPEAAVARAIEMAEQGADIIDVGGESTRPGSDRVSVEEELNRVVPVIRETARAVSCAISVDTMKAKVAEEALGAGAHIINDVSALQADPAMAGVAASSGAGLVLMHMKGTPRTMQENPSYGSVVDEVLAELRAQADQALSAGCSPAQLCIDPGIGFGKDLDHNLSLLRELGRFAELGYPLLVGVSRKRFLGMLTGKEYPADRMAGSLAAAVFCMMNGAQILRVHDVKESCDAARVVDKLRYARPDNEPV